MEFDQRTNHNHNLEQQPNGNNEIKDLEISSEIGAICYNRSNAKNSSVTIFIDTHTHQSFTPFRSLARKNEQQQVIMMRHNSICRSRFVVLIFVVSTVVSLFLQTTISTTTTTTNSNNNNYDIVVDAFVGTSPPVLSPTNVCHSVFLRHDEERYSSVISTTTRRKLFLSLDATTRRQSFGDLLGSTLALPALVDTASSTLFPLPANAADDYPFKVRTKNL